MPVRDPRLPSSLYEMALERMLVLCEAIAPELEGPFLRALRAWGNTSALKEYLDAFLWRRDNPNISEDEVNSKLDLDRRFHQTAANQASGADRLSTVSSQKSDSIKLDPLYSVSSVRQRVAARDQSTRVSAMAMAELYRQSGDFEACLQHYLKIGQDFSPPVDEECLSAVMNNNLIVGCNASPYKFVLAFMQANNLNNFIFDVKDGTVNFVRLIGLPQAASFFVEHCGVSNKDSKDRRSAVPLRKIFDQLESSHPKILVWFLHLMFAFKLDIYMDPKESLRSQRSNSRNFRKAMHRRHLELLISFQIQYVKRGKQRWSIAGDKQSQREGEGKYESPLMALLRVLLTNTNVGDGIDVRDMLSAEKTKQGAFLLPRELAYALQKSGSSWKDSQDCVNLYLDDVGSVQLAVLYAEESVSYRDQLWKRIVAFSIENGRLGELLDAANFVRADLSALVRQIPNDTTIPGLKETLLSAIRLYKQQVDLNIAARNLIEEDEQSLKVRSEYFKNRGARGDAVVVLDSSPETSETVQKISEGAKRLGQTRTQRCLRCVKK